MKLGRGEYSTGTVPASADLIVALMMVGVTDLPCCGHLPIVSYNAHFLCTAPSYMADRNTFHRGQIRHSNPDPRCSKGIQIRAARVV